MSDVTPESSYSDEQPLKTIVIAFAPDKCVLNGCQSKQGSGTWVRVGESVPLPVCEAHWQALRDG